MLPWCTPTRNSIRCSTGIYGKSVDLPKLDILLCWHESGNGPKTDLRFTDLPGVWQHFSVPPSAVNVDALEEGIGFDGSSIRGF
jgi:hypothetical protein